MTENKRLLRYCLDFADEDLSKTCDGLVFRKDNSDYYVMLPPDTKFGTVCHESVHLIGKIFRDRGQRADYGNDEIFACYTGWIADEIVAYINKVYNCFPDAATQ